MNQIKFALGQVRPPTAYPPKLTDERFKPSPISPTGGLLWRPSEVFANEDVYTELERFRREGEDFKNRIQKNPMPLTIPLPTMIYPERHGGP